MSSDLRAEDIEHLTVVQLKQHLEVFGLPKSGKKEELKKRLSSVISTKEKNNDSNENDTILSEDVTNSRNIIGDVQENSNTGNVNILEVSKDEPSALEDYEQQNDQLDIHADDSGDELSSCEKGIISDNFYNKSSSIQGKEQPALKNTFEEEESCKKSLACKGSSPNSTNTTQVKKKRWGVSRGGASAAPPIITSKSIEELILNKDGNINQLSPDVAASMQAMRDNQDPHLTVDLTGEDEVEENLVVTVSTLVDISDDSANQIHSDVMDVEEGEVADEEISRGDLPNEKAQDDALSDVDHSDQSGVEEDTQLAAAPPPLSSPNKEATFVKQQKATKSGGRLVRLRETKAIGYLVEEPVRECSPSPAKFQRSTVLKLSGLVRPFTDKQLRELLSRYGALASQFQTNLWLDKIKTKAYAIYESEEAASLARESLDGCRWPPINTRPLHCDFSTLEEFEWMQEHGDSNKSMPRSDRTEPRTIVLDRVEQQPEVEKKEKLREVDARRRERPVTEKERVEKDDRQNNRKRHASNSPQPATVVPPPPTSSHKSRDRPNTAGSVGEMPPQREWDRGKKQRVHRRSKSPTPQPVLPARRDRQSYELERQEKAQQQELRKKEAAQKEKQQPARLLDQLFLKTKTTPSVYWMPLSKAQVEAKSAAGAGGESQSAKNRREDAPIMTGAATEQLSGALKDRPHAHEQLPSHKREAVDPKRRSRSRGDRNYERDQPRRR